MRAAIETTSRRRGVDATSFRAIAFLALMAVVLPACAGTPIQREYQAAQALTTAAKSIENSAEFDIATADQNAKALDIVKGARDLLKEAIAKRRAGLGDVADAGLDSVFAAVLKVVAILEGGD